MLTPAVNLSILTYANGVLSPITTEILASKQLKKLALINVLIENEYSFINLIKNLKTCTEFVFLGEGDSQSLFFQNDPEILKGVKSLSFTFLHAQAHIYGNFFKFNELEHVHIYYSDITKMAILLNTIICLPNLKFIRLDCNSHSSDMREINSFLGDINIYRRSCHALKINFEALPWKETHIFPGFKDTHN